MVTRQRVRQNVMVAAVVVGAVLLAAPARRTEAAHGGGPGHMPANVVKKHDAPPPHGGQQHEERTDLMTLLAGSRGAGVFDPGSWGAIDPGGWGIFDPGGWGIFDRGDLRDRGDRDGRPGGSSGGPDGGMRIMPAPPPAHGRPGDHRPEGVFDPGSWGIVPLLAANEAEIKEKSDHGVVSIRITGKNRRAIAAIQEVVKAGTKGVWLDVDRGGPSDRPGHQIRRDEGDRRWPGPGGGPGHGGGPRHGVSGAGQADPLPTEDVGPVEVEIIREGAVLKMEVPHPGAEKMKEAVGLQIKAVEKLAEALAAAADMNRALRSGKVRTRWEKHNKGAALVFMGGDELRKAAGKLEDFAKYLDGKGDDIMEARRRTAHYFRPAPRWPHSPPLMPQQGQHGQGGHGRR